jgi:hypothetical protein
LSRLLIQIKFSSRVLKIFKGIIFYFTLVVNLYLILMNRRKEVIKNPKYETNFLKNQVDSNKRKLSSSDEDESSKDKKHEKTEKGISTKDKVDQNNEQRLRTAIEEKNMIVLQGDDSIWKKNKESSDLLIDEKKSKEDEFEEYLEDLLF